MMFVAKSFKQARASLCALAFLAAVNHLQGAQPVDRWVGTWTTALLPESAVQDQTPLAGSTLREVVHVSLGGVRLRIKISNAFGTTPLSLNAVHVAVARPGGAIVPDTDRAMLFEGRAAFTLPPGATYVSDPLDFALAPLSDLAVSISLKGVPSTLTLHGGARATSFLQSGAAVGAAQMSADATKFTRWYFLAGIEVMAPEPAAAIAIVGDSITDGYGTTTDQNNRWTDELARRLYGNPDTAKFGVLNLGIGGNRLLRDGLGPNVLARFDRDVLAQAAVRCLVLFEGINDIGTRLDARKKGADYASAADIIAACDQIITRAKTHGLRVIGATITPYAGAGFYWSADGEADRQTINHWIRKSGRFDAVIDFDAALRDPEKPDRLAPPFDSGDHLHPSVAGYRHMAEAIDLSVFAQ